MQPTDYLMFTLLICVVNLVLTTLNLFKER